MKKALWIIPTILIIAIAIICVIIFTQNNTEENPIDTPIESVPDEITEPTLELPTEPSESEEMPPVEETPGPVIVLDYDNEKDFLGISYKEPSVISDNYVQPLQDLSEYYENNVLSAMPEHYVASDGDAWEFNPVHKPLKIRNNCWVSGQFMCSVLEDDRGYIEEVAPSTEAFLASIEGYVPYRIGYKECMQYDLEDIAESLWDSAMEGKDKYSFYYLGHGRFGALWPEYNNVSENDVPIWRNNYLYRIGDSNLNIEGVFWHSGEYTGLDFDVRNVDGVPEDSVVSMLDATAECISMPNLYSHCYTVDVASREEVPDTVQVIIDAGYDVQYALVQDTSKQPVLSVILTDGTLVDYAVLYKYEVNDYDW